MEDGASAAGFIPVKIHGNLQNIRKENLL